MLALFDDQAESYPSASAAWLALSCEEKLKHARWRHTLPKDFATKGFSLKLPVREHIRPRWWYVAISDCSGHDVAVQYDVHMWNPFKGWKEEFSIDRAEIYLITGFFAAIYSVLLFVQAYAGNVSRTRGRQEHPLLQILTASIACAVGAMMFSGWHLQRFAHDGRGIFVAYFLAKFLQTMSKFLGMSILLLVSQGCCITHGLQRSALRRLFVMLAPFVALCFALEVWGENAESRRYTTDSVYATGYGRILVVLDLFLLAIYASSLMESQRSECVPEKKHFYRVWGSAYGVWFLALPLSTIVAEFVAPWVRYTVVFAVSGSAHIVLLTALIVGLWPGRERSHIKLLEVTELSYFQCDPQCGEGRLGGGVAWRPLPDGL